MPGQWAAMSNAERWAAMKRRVAGGGGRAVKSPPQEDFYLQLALHLDASNWFELGRLCAAKGQMNAAVYLSPLIQYENGREERQILLAALVALFSHGNSPAAMHELEWFTKLARPPAVVEFAKSVTQFLQIYQEGLAAQDCKRLLISTEDWARMPLQERWKQMRVRGVLGENAELLYN